ncbi:glycosyltransferase family 1 protein [Glycomyces albus]
MAPADPRARGRSVRVRRRGRRADPGAPYLGGAAEPRSYDYVFATDWRPYGAPAKAIIEEIRALKAAGRSVGVLQLETFRYVSAYTRPLCDPVQDLINRGVVGRVLPIDEIEVGTLVIRYPPVLQFKPAHEFRLKAAEVIILANQAPSERDGSDRRYIASVCSENARAMFGVEPKWLPEGPQTRTALLSDRTLPSEAILEIDFPCVVDPEEWEMPRERFRSDLPVVGRHSRDHYTKWPETRERLLQVYPDDCSFDVRIMGGTNSVADLLGQELPVNWTSYGYDAMAVKAFLYQLDFWVYFHHPVLIESFGLAVLEAMATGCVVILPEQFEPTFGAGAIYCREDEVRSVIRDLYGDFARYRAQSDNGLETVRRRFSHSAMLERLESLQPLVS